MPGRWGRCARSRPAGPAPTMPTCVRSTSEPEERRERPARDELVRGTGECHASLLQHHEAIGALGHAAIVTIDDKRGGARSADVPGHTAPPLHGERRQAL